MTDEQLTPQQRAERDAHKVKASDDLTREAEGREHPAEGHDVRELHPERYDDQGRPKLAEGWHYDEGGNPVEDTP